jgi:hypothetical protein
MTSTADLLVITNGIWGVAAIAAIWSLVYFTKVKLSSPAKTGDGTGTRKNAAKVPPETSGPDATVESIAAARKTGAA